MPTSREPDELVKFGCLMQISDELLTDSKPDFMAIIYDSMFPQTLSSEEIESRRQFKEAYDAESARLRKAIQADHDKTLSECQPLIRPILELHGPVFATDGRYAGCEGCDPGSNAEDEAEFPCQTYELAKSL